MDRPDERQSAKKLGQSAASGWNGQVEFLNGELQIAD